MDRQKLVEEVTKKLADEGKLIEAGWIGLRMLSIPEDASQQQLFDMRTAFFAGAQHLFGSIMAILEPDNGVDPTENDMKRLDLINAELTEFGDQYKAMYITPAKGRS